MDKILTAQRRVRFWIQGLFAAVTNGNWSGFVQGRIYRGPLKNLCVPGLNCYSCPGALGSCPIGALQAVASSPDYALSVMVVGFLMLVGSLLGRFVCGFLCPFGWVQDLLHRIPVKKRSTKKLRPLTYVKYAVLLLFVVLLPLVPVNSFGMGDPTFCKYVCPQGVLQGALPLAAANPSLRESLGLLFGWKFGILLLTVVLSATFYRPFCKWICPLGAIYALFNRFSLYRIGLREEACIHCGRCNAVCKMDCTPEQNPNAPECIRCGDCVAVCPTGALCKPGRPCGAKCGAQQAES